MLDGPLRRLSSWHAMFPLSSALPPAASNVSCSSHSLCSPRQNAPQLMALLDLQVHLEHYSKLFIYETAEDTVQVKSPSAQDQQDVSAGAHAGLSC